MTKSSPELLFSNPCGLTFCPHPTWAQSFDSLLYKYWLKCFQQILPNCFPQTQCCFYLRDVCSVTFICLMPRQITQRPSSSLSCSLPTVREGSVRNPAKQFHWKHWHTPETDDSLVHYVAYGRKALPFHLVVDLLIYMPTGQRTELTSRLRVWNVRSITNPFSENSNLYALIIKDI